MNHILPNQQPPGRSANRPPTPSSGSVSWPLVILLGVVALARPLARITDAADSQVGVLLLTLVVTAVWVLVVGLGRTSRPVLTLTLAGVAYVVMTLPLSAVLSTVLDGSFSGPLANPVAIVPLLAVNAAWGALAGVLALGVQRLRG